MNDLILTDLLKFDYLIFLNQILFLLCILLVTHIYVICPSSPGCYRSMDTVNTIAGICRMYHSTSPPFETTFTRLNRKQSYGIYGT